MKITPHGLALQPLGPATNDPLIGESCDRHVAVMILQAGLRANDYDDQAAVATLQAAAAQTTSTRFRQAIGSQARVIALGRPGRLGHRRPALLRRANQVTVDLDAQLAGHDLEREPRVAVRLFGDLGADSLGVQ